MDEVNTFKEYLALVSGGQGTFRESGEQGKVLMDMCRQLPEEQQLECLRAYLEVILRENFNIVAARQYCSEFVTAVLSMSPSVQKQMISYALDKIQNRISFEEQTYVLRMRLAEELENDQEWVAAAKVLSQIPLDSGQKQYGKDTKQEINMKIGRLYLTAEEYVEAENYIQRVGMLIDEATPEEFRIQHSAAFARIQDYRRKYIEAAQRYHRLSSEKLVAESERTQALKSAVNCVLLAPSTPQRSRFLAVLLKDERTFTLAQYGFLRKVLDGKTIKRAEIDLFAQNLQPHQREALTADGTSLLERNVLEHNILSTKKYFRVASFQALSRLLDIPVDKVEKIIVHMVAEDRLKVRINHITNSVTFDQEHALNIWDKKLESICAQVNRAVEAIATRHPQWYESTIAS
ncbi:hypothetical protein RvY_14055 [Ramazzottius varieornatus]|uniref:COP9 signalosome complex subunit 4 n=1 Tax=Ramazzottius varieornatus TaxID=947166 RepID=A0A1D1VRQ5_RAMVA|nr:hypothetical protein RvY_14055 [Ramazzottius varieornatus]